MSTEVQVSLISAIAVVLAALIQRGNIQARRAARDAKQAAVYSKPTGNGFAKKVLDYLEGNEEQMREIRLDIGELYKRDHIDHDHNRKTDKRLAALESKEEPCDQ